MTTPALTTPSIAPARPADPPAGAATVAPRTFANLRPSLPALLLGILALGLVFRVECAAAYAIWSDSTAYSHCFFVVPIAAYLAWDRRQAISACLARPMPLAALLALPLGVAWLAAERVGIMEGRQLVALALLQVLFLGVLGWRLYRTMSVPLLYLFFLVPFGAFLTPFLQTFTSRFVAVGLDVLGIPAYVDDTLIDIPEGSFYVAEACAGLRFLIAAVAFGVLYAFLIYRSTWRRAVFIGMSIVIPVIANGFRALGIVVLGHVLGSAEAAAADHLLYGWIFFSMVLLAMIAAGMPFREDHAPVRAAPERGPALGGSPRAAWVAAGLAVILAATGPAAAMALDAASRAPVAAIPLNLILPAQCHPTPTAPAASEPGPGDGTVWSTSFGCDPFAITVRTVAMAPRSNPAVALAALRRIDGEGLSEDTTFHSLDVPGGTPPTWRLIETVDPGRMTAAEIWLDGTPAGTGLSFRLKQALNSILGAHGSPVLVTVTADPGVAHMPPQMREDGRAALVALLTAQPDLAAQLDGRSNRSASGAPQAVGPATPPAR